VEFRVVFHEGFRVAGAYARDGVDLASDAIDPLPADSLKGVMRAAAVSLVGRTGLVERVFGTPATPSVWAWSGARLPEGQTWQVGVRHRVSIDAQAHAARPDLLVTAERVWAPQATFTVTRVGYLDPSAEADHLALLRVSAGAVHGLGGWRRRGLGWVQISPADAPVGSDDVDRVLQARETAAGQVDPPGAEVQDRASGQTGAR